MANPGPALNPNAVRIEGHDSHCVLLSRTIPRMNGQVGSLICWLTHCHPASAIRYLSSIICLRTVICHLPSVIRHLSSIIRHPSSIIMSIIRHTLSVIHYPSSAIHHLRSAICHQILPSTMSSVICLPSPCICPPASTIMNLDLPSAIQCSLVNAERPISRHVKPRVWASPARLTHILPPRDANGGQLQQRGSAVSRRAAHAAGSHP